MKILSQVRCACDGRGNPLPSLAWEIAGEPVNHSSDVPVKEVPLGKASVRSLITLHGLDEDPPPLVCRSVNPLGADSFVFNVSASQTQLGDDISRKLYVNFVSLLPVVSLHDCCDLRGHLRPPFCVPAHRLWRRSAGHAAAVRPAAALLLQVRHEKKAVAGYQAADFFLLASQKLDCCDFKSEFSQVISYHLHRCQA